MIEYFPTKIVAKAKEHAVAEFPKESIGIVVGDRYIPCDNIHEEPEQNARLEKGVYEYYYPTGCLEAIIHSHIDFPHCSLKDQEAQISTNVPWGIINMRHGNPVSHWFWGDQLERQEYLGRPFHYGCYDCYGLIRDWFIKERNIFLPPAPRGWDFWFEGKNLFEDYLFPRFKNGTWTRISDWRDVEEGDMLLFKLNNSPVWNHSALYIGNGQIMHHLEFKLSKIDLINRWAKLICGIARCNGADENGKA